MFRELSEAEELEFRKWARENYTPYSEINGVWHPIIQAECVAITATAALELLTEEVN